MAHPEDMLRSEDIQHAAEEVADRLTGLGITVRGDETPAELVRIREAAERFEIAVASRGGNLTVDDDPEGETTVPDDPHFILPQREELESVDRYVERLTIATDELLRHESTP